jgi:hypothetical protein
MPVNDVRRQPGEPPDTFSAGQAADPKSQPSFETAAARDGIADAVRVISAQYAAGIDLDTIGAHHEYVSAALAGDARTSYGQAYAAEYAETTRTLIADLRADAAAARTERPEAGTPHPTRPGWIADRSGVYVHERGELAPPRTADKEAC